MISESFCDLRILGAPSIVKTINRPASIAHVWGRDSRVLTEIARVLSASYVVSAPKASKKGDAFRVQIMQAK